MNDKDRQLLLSLAELGLSFLPGAASAIFRIVLAAKEASAETIADVEALVARIDKAQASVPEWK